MWACYLAPTHMLHIKDFKISKEQFPEGGVEHGGYGSRYWSWGPRALLQPPGYAPSVFGGFSVILMAKPPSCATPAPCVAGSTRWQMSAVLRKVSVSAFITILGNIHQERLFTSSKAAGAARGQPCLPAVQEVLTQIYEGKCADHSLGSRIKHQKENEMNITIVTYLFTSQT